MPTEAPTEPPLIYAQMAEDYQDLSADAQIASPYAKHYSMSIIIE